MINMITGLVNLFSFLSLTVTTRSVDDFLGATFIFASSIFLEALSLQSDSRKTKSWIVFIITGLLYLIGIIGLAFSVAGLANFLNVYFNSRKNPHLMLSSFSHSLYTFSPIDMNLAILASGIVASSAPLCLACREAILPKFRKKHYNLNCGLYGK